MNSLDILNKYFGYGEFRPGQLEIINSIYSGEDTLVVMPTGGGKSLCYQVPALLMHGTAIVISPLIALMKDQVDTLLSKGIPAAFINSSMSNDDFTNTVTNLMNGSIKLLYIAPERLENKRFLELIKSVKISFLAIDEAHCLSEWGHDFRPSYLNISNIFDSIERTPIIALTATATPEVQDDICKFLKFKSPSRFIQGFDRSNLSYQVQHCKDINEKMKVAAGIARSVKKGSAIFYCGSRKRVEALMTYFLHEKINCEMYHAGLSDSKRKEVQEKFLTGAVSSIIATNAFGMGIDKADVRKVVHLDLCSTIEGYYQEAGRAGRDGIDSDCVILYNPKDRDLQEFFIANNFPDEENVKIVAHNIIKIFISEGLTANNNSPIQLSLSKIAIELGISSMLMSNIIDLLNKNNIVSKTRLATSVQLKFISDKNRIIEYVNYITKDRKLIVEAILRSVGTEAFHKDVDFNLIQIARSSSVTPTNILNELQAMYLSGILNYSYSGDFEGYVLNPIFYDNQNLNIDFMSIQRRYKLAVSKLNRMQEFAETESCKRHYVLTYFKEKPKFINCDNCSSCTSQTKSKPTIRTEVREFLEQKILESVYQLNSYFGVVFFVDFLKGNKSYKTEIHNLQKLDNFGVARQIEKIDIESILKNLIVRSYIEKTIDKYPKLEITPLGIEKLKLIPDKIKLGIVSSVDKETEHLFSKLKQIRNDIAKSTRKKPNEIASNVSLQTIASSPPNDYEELRIKLSSLPLFSKAEKKLIELFNISIAKKTTYSFNETDSYLKANRPLKKVSNFLKNGFNIHYIADEMCITEGEVAKMIQTSLADGFKVFDIDTILTAAIFNKIHLFVADYPNMPLSSIHSRLELDLDYASLRIAVAYSKYLLKIPIE